MPINPGLHIDQSQTPDEFGAFGRQWYAQVEERSTWVALDTELQLPYGMGRLDADNTFTDNFLPLNPGSEYPLYSDLFKAPSPADPLGIEMDFSSVSCDSPDSPFTFDLQACDSPPFPGVGWPQFSSPLDYPAFSASKWTFPVLFYSSIWRGRNT
ncbi:hypothetical protein CPB84DRAFT_1784549 [Gymnopilus junonius]|uniref:Uncharacterized protein n=1 Tax=Gymnopilus junonius TaxID=109634 RepID=A0A9P5TLD4_GYMJU|nr:hypothetical protein CPB84DRAFT_1784549 [Gymnopilus junonius]